MFSYRGGQKLDSDDSEPRTALKQPETASEQRFFEKTGIFPGLTLTKRQVGVQPETG